MHITRIDSWVEHFELKRPYRIAYKAVSAVDNVIVRIRTDRGITGYGCASPAPFVTGENLARCRAAFSPEGLSSLVGEDIREIHRLTRNLAASLRETPAACAALDMALHDCYAQFLDRPLCDVLGRVCNELETSVTVGICTVEETLQQARELVRQGFPCLKIKIGSNWEEDFRRIAELRSAFCDAVRIRVDANQGYSLKELLLFIEKTEDLTIEFIEQPLKAAAWPELRSLPEEVRSRIALDESLTGEAQVPSLLAPTAACGIFNIKLMKVGGIEKARRIAAAADLFGISLLWGCMDESAVSIAAALHAAFSCPATRYLDLDGSLDLKRDIAQGGFTLHNGVMRTTDRPGLGVTVQV